MRIGIGNFISTVRGIGKRAKAPDHTLSVGVTGVSVLLSDVNYIDVSHKHTISAAVTGVTVELLPA